MKKKHRNPKASQYDYKKHTGVWNGMPIHEESEEYYGIHRDGARVKIDIKRMKKIKTSGVPEEVLEAASNIPRNTTYFLPKKIHRDDYVCNQFRDKLTELTRQWGEIKGAFSKKGNTDPENIYSSKDLDAAVKLAESKKDKTMKEMERNYEKDLASAEKDNARLEKKLSETDAGLKRALGTIEELKKRNEETIKNAEEHEKEAVRKAIEGIEDNKEELENTKKELEALHKTSEKNKADYASYREKKEKEEKEREKYTYDPNYDHYYSDILPKVVNTLEFSHTDLLVREGCIFISLLASVIALIYVL